MQFPGISGGAGAEENEFAFMCGPVLHQLCYQTAPTQVTNSDTNPRKAPTPLAARDESEDDRRLKKVLAEVAYRQKSVDQLKVSMHKLQGEIAGALNETRANDEWWRAFRGPLERRVAGAESEAQKQRDEAERLEKALAKTRRELTDAEGMLHVAEDRAKELMAILGDAAADSEASAARAEQTQRFATGRAQNILKKIWLEMAILSRLSAWQEWAAHQARVRVVCKSLLVRMTGNTLAGAFSDWMDAAREQKRLRRAQEQCSRRWRNLLLRQLVAEWVGSVQEQKQSDIVTQAKNAAALIKESQARMKHEMEEAISHRDTVIRRMDSRCATEVERVLQLECTLQTQARHITGLKLRIQDLEEEAVATKEKLALSMFSDTRWKGMYTKTFDKLKHSLAEVKAQAAQLEELNDLYNTAKGDIEVFCTEIVRLKWDVAALTRQLAEVSEALLENLAIKAKLLKKVFRCCKDLQICAQARRLQRLRTALKGLAVTVVFRRQRRARRLCQQHAIARFQCRRVCLAWREFRAYRRRHSRALLTADRVLSLARFRATQRVVLAWFACTVWRRRRIDTVRQARARRDAGRHLCEWQQWCRSRMRARDIVARSRQVWSRALLAHFFRVYAWEAMSTGVAKARRAAKDALIKCETAEIEQHLAKGAMLANGRNFLSEKRQLQEALELAQNRAADYNAASAENKRLRNKLMASQRLCEELHVQVASERTKARLRPPPLSPREAVLQRNQGGASVLLSRGEGVFGGGGQSVSGADDDEGGGGGGCGGADGDVGGETGVESFPAGNAPAAPPPTRTSSGGIDDGMGHGESGSVCKNDGGGRVGAGGGRGGGGEGGAGDGRKNNREDLVFGEVGTRKEDVSGKGNGMCGKEDAAPDGRKRARKSNKTAKVLAPLNQVQSNDGPEGKGGGDGVKIEWVLSTRERELERANCKIGLCQESTVPHARAHTYTITATVYSPTHELAPAQCQHAWSIHTHGDVRHTVMYVSTVLSGSSVFA